MAASGKARNTRFRLLLVDAKDDGLTAMRQSLTRGGYRADIERVANATELRLALAGQHWDAVVCACGVPALSPRTVLAQVRRQDVDLPCLVLADSGRERSVLSAIKAGVRDSIRRDEPARMMLVIEREVLEARQRADYRAAVELLRDSEDRFRALAANLPGMVFQLAGSRDGGLRFLYVSEGGYKLLGIRAQALISSFTHFFDAIEPGDRQGFLNAVGESAATLKTLNWEGRVRARGRGKWISLRSTPQRFVDGGIHWHGIASDITRSKETEATLRKSREQLSELSDYLEAAKEEERERIARDIHDELGSVLVGIKIEASLLASKMPAETPALREKLVQIETLLDRAMATAGRVARELRPGILNEFGLRAAIECQAEDFSQRTGIPCHIYYDPGLEVDEPTSLALFRILQEALTNVAKHSHASMVALRVEREERHVVLEVRDNGRGISDVDTGKSRSFGLRGIRERSRRLKGSFLIEPTEQGGARLLVTLPTKTMPDLADFLVESQQNLF